VFFAGPLLNVAFTDPSFLDSKFDAGLDVFALAIEGSDTFFRDGVEIEEEDVKTTNPNLDLKLGRPIGNFFKMDLRYQLGYRLFSRADDTVLAHWPLQPQGISAPSRRRLSPAWKLGALGSTGERGLLF
jgi:outer membrane protein assembly factor BamA